ncbi:hypothetical protein [Nocardioides solisilvae]|uniref:hypothetical protein n=1 Tax=Nocardioides solisilvae TaxID=1542435 RepID=UPI0013A5B5A9|nr:hypothetical protein [Nocardioides solisilvae]
MSFADDMKKKIDELEVERRLKELADGADKTVNETVEKAGALAHERRGEVEGWIAHASEAVNTKTKGQYADKVDKVRTGLLSGLDKLAAKRPMHPVAEIEESTEEDGPGQAQTGQAQPGQAQPGDGPDRPEGPPLS